MRFIWLLGFTTLFGIVGLGGFSPIDRIDRTGFADDGNVAGVSQTADDVIVIPQG